MRQHSNNIREEIMEKIEENKEIAPCPYCGTSQEIPQKKHKKCKSCGKTMYSYFTKFKAIQHTSNMEMSCKVLVQENQCFLYEWLNKLAWYGITLKAINTRQQEHEDRTGTRLSDHDNIWGILNELVVRYMKEKKLNKYNYLSQMYVFMAELAKEESKDPFIYLQSAQKMKLEYLAGMNAKFVRIRINCGKNDPEPCPICESWKNAILTIEEAQKNLPFPAKACKNKYCNVSYNQVFSNEWPK